MLIFLHVLAVLVRLFGNDEHFIFVGIRSVMLMLALQNEREAIRKRQEQGIAAARARGVKFGRPAIELPDEVFAEIIRRWEKGELKLNEAAATCGMSPTTYYRRLREYRAAHPKKK